MRLKRERTGVRGACPRVRFGLGLGLGLELGSTVNDRGSGGNS